VSGVGFPAYALLSYGVASRCQVSAVNGKSLSRIEDFKYLNSLTQIYNLPLPLTTNDSGAKLGTRLRD
jgi:hypothetical protein